VLLTFTEKFGLEIDSCHQ